MGRKPICNALGVLLAMTSVAAGSDRCPLCRSHCHPLKDRVCVTSVEPGKASKSCWDVECEEVCIPAVRFPWEKRGVEACDGSAVLLTDKCGKVRRVNRLRKHDYECETCQYNHSVIRRCPRCGPPASSPCVSGLELPAVPSPSAGNDPPPVADSSAQGPKIGPSLLGSLRRAIRSNR
jgi:hypothetical protein